MKTDIEIAQENQMQPISVIAEKLNLTPEEVEPYGKYKAKIDKNDIHNPENFGKMALEMDTFLPATPFGILTLLERYNIETKGKHCVIIGRSRIVGKPMSILMGRKDFPGNSTVTLVHSYTENIEE